MNSEVPDDWLEEALKTRGAMTAPSGFTAAVVRSLDARPPDSQLSRFWMDQGLALGFTLAILGLGLGVDVNRLGALLGEGLQSPATAVLVAVTLCLSAAWLSIAADETI